MPRTASSMPTGSELAILRVLWERGPSTVREVHDQLSRLRPTGYTTVLKLMQIMAQKGLVGRDESQRTHVYSARLRERNAQRRLVKDILHRAFGGSTHKLVMHALAAGKTSPQELAQIRSMLDKATGD